jgi:hypothetical protein
MILTSIILRIFFTHCHISFYQMQEMVFILLNNSASERTRSMVNGSYSIKSIIYNDLGWELQRLIKVCLILKIHCNSLSFILPIKQEVYLLTPNLHFRKDSSPEIRTNFVKRIVKLDFTIHCSDTNSEG